MSEAMKRGTREYTYWLADKIHAYGDYGKEAADVLRRQADELEALQARVGKLEAEMRRYLPVIEGAECRPILWDVLTEGTGLATANGYRAALASREGSEG